jgi:hypothetical protein
MITMISHKEVTSEDLNGKVQSSIDYLKQTFMKKSTNKDVKEGFNQMRDTINYYLNEQVDNDFFVHAVKYHNAQERNLKNSQSFDKKLNRQSTGRLIIVSRLSELLDSKN